MQANPFEEAIARKYKLERAPTLFAQREMVPPIAFSRVRVDGAARGRNTEVPRDVAFAFLVALAPMPIGDVWIERKHEKLQASTGDALVFNLTENSLGNFVPPYDFLRFYLSANTMDQLAYDRGVRRVGSLRTNTVGIQDPTMLGLAQSILPALQEPASAPALFLDSIALAFHAHVMYTYGGLLGAESSVRTGLAPWQLRRADEFIEAHLDGDPSIADLARECRLSASHFARAFRQATGMPPHQWLTKRRVERAKKLVLEGSRDLAQIALDCGFVDQSHLTRVFARHEGHSPGKWRRLRRY
jgi:AraC family transcriptional regulator